MDKLKKVIDKNRKKLPFYSIYWKFSQNKSHVSASNTTSRIGISSVHNTKNYVLFSAYKQLV